MANRYWVGGTATWDSTATGKWATTSGGAPGAAVPTATDDVFFDTNAGAASANVTIATGMVARSVNCTGFNALAAGGAGTLTHPASTTISIGDGTAGASNIALQFVSGMTYAPASGSTSLIQFVSTSATAQGVTFHPSGNAGAVTFNGVGGSWRLDGPMQQSTAGNTTLTAGTLNTNGQTCSWGQFSSTNSNTRTLTLGSSAITVSGTGTAWNTGTTTGLTVTANTATVTLSGAGITFNCGTFNLNGLSLVLSGSGTANVGSGTITMANLTRTGTATKTDALTLSGTTVVTGTLTLAGNSVTNRLLVQSNIVGTARTFTNTGATMAWSNVDFTDITLGTAYNASAITGNSGDAGGNTNITFTTSATQTWSGTSGGNWSANAWSGRVPLPQDDVVISSAFSASQTVTVDMPRAGRSLSFSGATGTPTFNPVNTTLYGSLTIHSGVTASGAGTLTVSGRSTYTITSAGKTYGAQIFVTAFGGTYTLQDSIATTSNIVHTNGTLDLNGFNASSASFTSASGLTRSLTLGSGTWSLTSTAATTVWSVNTTGLTFSGASATIAITTVSANVRTVTPGTGLTYDTLTYTVAGSTGGLDMGNSATFNTINFSDITNARTLRFQAATTTTVTNFNVNGTSGKLMSIASTTAATHTLSKSSGTVSDDYLSITNSIATGGASWYAGANSTNVSGNTGWIFTAPPAATTSNFFIMF